MDYPEDDFEDMYADELEVMREFETFPALNEGPLQPKSNKVDSISTKLKESETTKLLENDTEIAPKVVEVVSTKRSADHLQHEITQSAKRPREEKVKLSPTGDGAIEINRCKRSLEQLYGNDKDSTNVQVQTTNRHQPRVWKRIPPGNFIPVTDESKKRVYLRMRSEDWILANSQHEFCTQRALRLLAVPFDDVRKEADEEKVRCESRRIAIGEDGVGMDERRIGETDLWVEKYKPKKYVELLSDDGINRTLLHWLRLWDKTVFARDFHPKQKRKTEVKAKFGGQRFPSKNHQGTTFAKTGELVEDLDPLGCPVQKMALLCGPPGFGKTTLAHVIARHAGYNVVEINASDDRSPDVLRRQVEASTQMRSVLGENPRPNCLIIDEIDGAQAASINLLIAMTTNAGVGGSAKKRKGSGALRRPVICICNDRFAPALRPLRQQALVLIFPPTMASRLASRLQDILRTQELALNLSTLLVLCDKAENDIRSCLATLQFARNQQERCGYGKTRLPLSDILSHSLGQKDTQKSHWTVWQQIFTIPRNGRWYQSSVTAIGDSTKGKNGSEVFGTEDKTTSSARFANVVRLVQGNGDFDRLYQGVYENYLVVKEKDARMEPACDSLDWLCFVDLIQSDIRRTQNYALYPYIPYAAAIFHLKFAVSGQPKITYPTAQIEMTTKLTKCENLRSSVISEGSARMRAFVNPTILVTDVLPNIAIITKPPLRPVNTQLYSPQERKELSSLVDVMVSYNLTYVQERQPDGQYKYVLEPNIDEIVSYAVTKPSRTLNYAAKQLIAREIETEKMRRIEEKIRETKKMVEKPRIEKIRQQPGQTPNSNMTDKPLRDFFGRPLENNDELKENPSKMADRDCASTSSVTSVVWFHFKEGYSNAVRRNVRVADFL